MPISLAGVTEIGRGLPQPGSWSAVENMTLYSFHSSLSSRSLPKWFQHAVQMPASLCVFTSPILKQTFFVEPEATLALNEMPAYLEASYSVPCSLTKFAPSWTPHDPSSAVPSAVLPLMCSASSDPPAPGSCVCISIVEPLGSLALNQ